MLGGCETVLRISRDPKTISTILVFNFQAQPSPISTKHQLFCAKFILALFPFNLSTLTTTTPPHLHTWKLFASPIIANRNPIGLDQLYIAKHYRSCNEKIFLIQVIYGGEDLSSNWNNLISLCLKVPTEGGSQARIGQCPAFKFLYFKGIPKWFMDFSLKPF